MAVSATGCMQWDYAATSGDDDFNLSGRDGHFVVCEGNFQYGNASLSFIGSDGTTLNNIFNQVNDMKLGDVAQSMSIVNGNVAWICVNNSNVVFAVDANTLRERGRITTGLTSPRYIHFVSPTKAYVTQLWGNCIAIVNTATYTVSGYITVPDMSSTRGSTEQMVQIDDKVYVSCWSYNNRIIRIDVGTDSVDASVNVGVQPRSLVKDCHNRLWTLTDGGYEGNPTGHEAPKLVCLSAPNLKMQQSITFTLNDQCGSLTTNAAADSIYWFRGADLWAMSVDDTTAPTEPYIANVASQPYALTVDQTGIYVANAGDYRRSGQVYRFIGRTPVDTFTVGINPTAIVRKQP